MPGATREPRKAALGLVRNGCGISCRCASRTPLGGRQKLVGWFESDQEGNRWLNDLVCIAEGGISATGPDVVINVYAGIHEMEAQHNRL
jgi:hypothetical protein